MSKELKPAGPGEIYICAACGRTFTDPYKVDVSCMLNRQLCKKSSIKYDEKGRIVSFDPIKEDE